MVRHPQGQGNTPLSLLEHSSGTRTLESPTLIVQNLLPRPVQGFPPDLSVGALDGAVMSPGEGSGSL